jgi:predicted permease
MVSSMFVNGGNYGLAATKFAFGDQALARAMVCFVSGTVLIYTLGVLLSSMGKLPVWDALRQLLKVPAVYSILAAILVLRTNIKVPLFVDRSVTLLGDASIPLMLVILGLQIAQARIWPRGRLRLISSAAFLQLVMTPLISLLVAHFMGMTGVSRQSAVLISSMPAAVVTTVLAVQYDLDGALVSGTVVITTLLSPITLAPLIAYLT